MDITQIEEMLKKHEQRITKIERQLVGNNLAALLVKRKSIKEFILEKKPKGFLVKLELLLVIILKDMKTNHHSPLTI